MQKRKINEAEALVLRDQQITEGRKNYFLAGPVCFDEKQIAELRDYVDKHHAPAEVADAGAKALTGSHYDEGRRTQICSLSYEYHRWVYDIIEQCFRQANEHMRVDIVPSMSDPIQLLRYDEGESGHFRWHGDTIPSDMTRKITIVVPLSSPDEYEGGDLQFNQGGVISSLRQEPGRALAFPSWLIHQVTPVTKGRRYSLAAWIRGPNWR